MLVIAGTRAATTTARTFTASTGTSAFAVLMSFCVGAVYGKTLAVLWVIDKVNGGIAQVINGNFINNNFHTIRFKGGIYVAEIIVESHAKVNPTATTTGYINA